MSLMNKDKALPFNKNGYIRIELSKGLDNGGSFLWQRREEKFFEFDDAEAVFKDLMLYMNNHDFPFDAEWDNKREIDMDLFHQAHKKKDK